MDPIPIKKRGRKKKEENIQLVISEEDKKEEEKEKENLKEEVEEPANKKRGRKPKGGKIISASNLINAVEQAKPNIILHLKCSLKDLDLYNEELKSQITNPLEYKPIIPPTIETYNETDYGLSIYQKENTSETKP